MTKNFYTKYRNYYTKNANSKKHFLKFLKFEEEKTFALKNFENNFFIQVFTFYTYKISYISLKSFFFKIKNRRKKVYSNHI